MYLMKIFRRVVASLPLNLKKIFNVLSSSSQNVIDTSKPDHKMSFTDFSKIETLKELNTFLADKSYIEGYVQACI